MYATLNSKKHVTNTKTKTKTKIPTPKKQNRKGDDCKYFKRADQTKFD